MESQRESRGVKVGKSLVDRHRLEHSAAKQTRSSGPFTLYFCFKTGLRAKPFISKYV